MQGNARAPNPTMGDLRQLCGPHEGRGQLWRTRSRKNSQNRAGTTEEKAREAEKVGGRALVFRVVERRSCLSLYQVQHRWPVSRGSRVPGKPKTVGQLAIVPGVFPSEYDDRIMGRSDGDVGNGQSQGWVITTGRRGREDQGREGERGGSEDLEVRMSSGRNGGSKI